MIAAKVVDELHPLLKKAIELYAAGVRGLVL